MLSLIILCISIIKPFTSTTRGANIHNNVQNIVLQHSSVSVTEKMWIKGKLQGLQRGRLEDQDYILAYGGPFCGLITVKD